MSFSLADKVAIVVGSSSGMGGQRQSLLLKRGQRLCWLHGVPISSQRWRKRLARTRSPARPMCKMRGTVDRLIATTLEHFGQIDVLVYVTGTNIPDRSLEVLSNETWDMMIQTNLTGAFYCTKAVLPTMRCQKDGLIIYVSSGAVQRPDTSGVSYQATKHGMVGLAHGTFQEEKENGIRTSMLFPGLTDTPIVLKRPVPTPPEVMAKSLQPQDVADACLLVASLPARVYVPELIMLPAGLA